MSSTKIIAKSGTACSYCWYGLHTVIFASCQCLLFFRLQIELSSKALQANTKSLLCHMSTLLSEWLVDERDKCSLLQVQLVLFICSLAGNESNTRSQGSPIQHTPVVINDDDDDFEATAGKFVPLVTGPFFFWTVVVITIPFVGNNH